MSLFPSMPRVGANIASNYTKRIADQHLWDRLTATPLGRWLKSLPRSGKYSAEALMYLADCIVKHQIGDSTPLRQFLSEVLGEAGPEMAKRMLNGSPEVSSAQERDPAAELLAMDPAEREELLAYYRELTPLQRERFEHVWANHLATRLSAFISMSREGRDEFLKLMGPHGRPPLTVRTAAVVNRLSEFIFPW